MKKKTYASSQKMRVFRKISVKEVELGMVLNSKIRPKLADEARWYGLKRLLESHLRINCKLNTWFGGVT